MIQSATIAYKRNTGRGFTLADAYDPEDPEAHRERRVGDVGSRAPAPQR
jgi:hypothetical protein